MVVVDSRLYQELPNMSVHPFERVLPFEEWTDDMKRVAVFISELFEHLYGEELYVRITRKPSAPWALRIDRGDRLILNYDRLGKQWFSHHVADEEILNLVAHEFASYKTGSTDGDEYRRETAAVFETVSGSNQPSVFLNL